MKVPIPNNVGQLRSLMGGGSFLQGTSDENGCSNEDIELTAGLNLSLPRNTRKLYRPISHSWQVPSYWPFLIFPLSQTRPRMG